MTNRGFVELHNPQGFFLIAWGFLLVTLIVAVGGIAFRIMAKADSEKRKEMRQELESKKILEGEPKP